MIKPIRNREDYEAAEAEAVTYAQADPEPGSAEASILERLLCALANYRRSRPLAADRYRTPSQDHG
jgi:antitoxin component HigA of HigAB toxin-antitoxin module